jgi:hypothetical protein
VTAGLTTGVQHDNHRYGAHPMYICERCSGLVASAISCCTWPSTERGTPLAALPRSRPPILDMTFNASSFWVSAVLLAFLLPEVLLHSTRGSYLQCCHRWERALFRFQQALKSGLYSSIALCNLNSLIHYSAIFEHQN